MFGLGMGEILLIAVIALLALGPDKLPDAARAIGKGIRDLRRQTRDLQDTLEKDTQIGDAVRELKSALRDEPNRMQRIPPRPIGIARGEPLGGQDGTEVAGSPAAGPETEQEAAAPAAAAAGPETEGAAAEEKAAAEEGKAPPDRDGSAHG
jgi:sec-independent protein translocase protein TatB